jgi:hypothetical protein
MNQEDIKIEREVTIKLIEIYNLGGRKNGIYNIKQWGENASFRIWSFSGI